VIVPRESLIVSRLTWRSQGRWWARSAHRGRLRDNSLPRPGCPMEWHPTGGGPAPARGE
jgi:hypothetical protein